MQEPTLKELKKLIETMRKEEKSLVTCGCGSFEEMRQSHRYIESHVYKCERCGQKVTQNDPVGNKRHNKVVDEVINLIEETYD